MIVKSKTNKSHYCNIPLYNPTKEEKQEIVKTILGSLNFMAYKKLKTKYACYCSWCDQYGLYTKDQFKQIRASKICPNCLRNIRTTTNLQIGDRQFIQISKGKDTYGYTAKLNWEFNKKPKLSLYQCLYTDRSQVSYRRGCVRNMYSLSGSYNLKDWFKCETYKYLGFFLFYKIHDNWFYEVQRTKKQVYESYKLTDVKSNQQKLIIDNIFNKNQIHYIINFDLKKADDVLKYNRYIRENEFEEILEKPLNIFFLDYLSRNHIKIKDFVDYIDDCKTLGIKVDKPKDFIEAHKRTADMVTELMYKNRKKALLKRFKDLESHSYANEDIEIKPFKTAKEIINAGSKLNNCIGTYIEKYAKGKTDLYYLEEKHKLIACIEIKHNKLIQARIVNNADYKKPVLKKWCKLNNFRIGA